MPRCLINSICCAIAIFISFVGCNRGVKHQVTAVARFDQGTPQEAIAAFDKAADVRGAEVEIIATDRAIAALMAGDAAGCEIPLRQTRQQMDFLRQKDLAERTKSIITDDKAVAWSGREFEQRMVDNLLVLSSFLGDRKDAFAYANQAMEHVFADHSRFVADNEEVVSGEPITTVGHTEPEVPPVAPTARHSANAFSAYLHAAIRSEIPMDSDVATDAIRQVGYWTAASPSTPAPILDTESGFGTFSPRGHGVVHVITFVGRITDWTVERSMPTTSALLLADQILSAIGDHTLPPTIAPVQIARPVAQFSPQPLVTRARVVGSQAAPPTVSTTLVDLNRAAYDSYLATRDEQLARAVARRIIKKGAVYAAKDQLAVDGGSGADLLLNLGGIAWEAMEKADTRHLQLLPARIEVLRMTLPAGQHEIELWAAEAADGDVPGESRKTRLPIIVDDGRNTFALCFRPHAALAGSLLTSDGNKPVKFD